MRRVGRRQLFSLRKVRRILEFQAVHPATGRTPGSAQLCATSRAGIMAHDSEPFGSR